MPLRKNFVSKVRTAAEPTTFFLHILLGRPKLRWNQLWEIAIYWRRFCFLIAVSPPVGSGTVPDLLWRCTQGCSLSYRSDVPRPRVVFLADGNDPVLKVADGVHTGDSRHVAHIEHLEPVHQQLFWFAEQGLAGAER